MARSSIYILLLLCLAVLLPSTVAHAVEYGGLGGLPANPDPSNDRTKSIFVYNLGPNQTKQDGVRVVNNSNESKKIEIYATDSEIASGGSFACKQKQDDKKDVGSWVRLNKKEVTLSASTEEVVTFDFTVPSGASVGEHNGCLVIQEQGDTAEKSGNGVQLSFRSAIRIAATVPGAIKKEVDFSDILIKKEAKKYILTAQLFNKGNVSLDTDVQVSVKDGLNRKAYQNGGVYPLLSQKQPIELNFEFPRPFWGGWYRVVGTADYNGDPNITLGASGEKNVRKNAPAKMLLVPPQPVAAAIESLLLLLLLILIVLVMRYLQNRKKASKTWRPYTIRSGDTLVGLAKSRGTKWRTVAKINKLRAPYELKSGTVIKLPAKK